MWLEICKQGLYNIGELNCIFKKSKILHTVYLISACLLFNLRDKHRASVLLFCIIKRNNSCYQGRKHIFWFLIIRSFAAKCIWNFIGMCWALNLWCYFGHNSWHTHTHTHTHTHMHTRTHTLPWMEKYIMRLNYNSGYNKKIMQKSFENCISLFLQFSFIPKSSSFRVPSILLLTH